MKKRIVQRGFPEPVASADGGRKGELRIVRAVSSGFPG